MARKITGGQLAAGLPFYEYVPYLWGGADPNTGWDCSGAMNWYIGYHWKMDIPGYSGGNFGPGKGHGPVVGDWALWVGVGKGAFPGTRPQPGDLIAWQPNVHMGMAVSATRFISAENPSAGTREDDIAGFFPWDPLVLRLVELAVGPVLPQLPAAPGPGADDYSPHIHNAGEQIDATGTDVAKYANAIATLRRR